MECKCETCIRENCQERTKQDDLCIVICCDDFLEHKMTNADRIRAMNDKELAEWIHNGISSDACDFFGYNIGYCDGSPCRGKAEAEIIAEWLKQPAEA